MKMKNFRLLIHNKNFSDESLLICSKDFPSLEVGNILEICLAEDSNSCPVLLQVTGFSDDLSVKGCLYGSISIDATVASHFQFKAYTDVIVRVIENLKDVSLDSVELTFKDQYLARSDMWRVKNHMINTCLFPEKKVDCFGIRCQVYEMYMQGESVGSGVVTEDTKIVYRSASSMVYLFIQMSCEMWDFDINGELYFEKAIDGFLPDLFSKWKKLHCNHDVTIVLFSRTFYEAKSFDEFPECMRECLQQDYKGRFFEDFYRVAVQNERYDDWGSTIILLKKLFNEYEDLVLNYHAKPDLNVPKARNSTASQGNFLEVLNMSLNVFEKHYMDRSFDRTGQLSVVITPGDGFFEVDRELTIITKQRIIDNGIGSDLVCLGEQPLHAVPLFKFYNKQLPNNAPSVTDDYNMPHWINLSFYSMKSQKTYTNFVPRIKFPTLSSEEFKKVESKTVQSKRSRHASEPDSSLQTVFDYNDHDRQVFKVPNQSLSIRYTRNLHRLRKRKETPPTTSSNLLISHPDRSSEEINQMISSEPAQQTFQYSHSHASSAAIAIPQAGQHSSVFPSSYQSSIEIDHNMSHRHFSREYGDMNGSPTCRTVVGSDPSYESKTNKQSLSRKLKPLVNPYNPSEIIIKLTSNRRRWTHVFPIGPKGIFLQQHHYQAIPQISAATLISVDKTFHNIDSSLQRSSIFSSEFDGISEHKSSTLSRRDLHSSSSNMSSTFGDVRSPNSGGRTLSLQPNDNLSWLLGLKGDQEWIPAVTTGVDWKSLVIPACLPITTDYFPECRSLQNDYVLSDYSLLPEDIIAENSVHKYFQNDPDSIRRSLTTTEVYKELICQRLQQGFQIILLSKHHSAYPVVQVSSSPQFNSAMFKNTQKSDLKDEYLLSIGRIFHRLNLDGAKITVTQYRPRHPHREITEQYHYRFQAPDSDTYGISWVNFTSERLENYNWNYLDHYICMRGEGEFELKKSLKYWRLRMLLLPAVQIETKKIIDGSPRCDLYNKFSNEDKILQREGILKFLENMNKIRRVSTNKPKTKISISKSDNPINIPHGSDNPNDNFPGDTKKLHDKSPELEIIQAMKAHDGLNFVKKPGWSQYTFISFEAVAWVMAHVEGIIVEQQAIKLLQHLVDKELISHVSRAKDYKFVYGFYLFYIGHWNDPEINKVCDINNYSDSAEAIYLFEREWMEVEFSPSLNVVPAVENYDFPSDEELWSTPYLSKSKLKFKDCNIQIDQGSEPHGRQEWGQLRYQNVYRPYEAFELIVEWMVATGNKAAELVQSWARKSNQFNLQLVPIPSDPFALPFSDDSDPLRGPIFIPLDLSCLMETSVQSLDEEGLLKLQEKILCKFGFIPYRNHIPISPPQYVHVSGSMFIMLPVRPKEAHKANKKHLVPTQNLPLGCSPHDDYITRHFSGIRNKRLSALNTETDTKIGFLWSWNYMITKRWKNAGTVDENFMRKVMKDFREFCLNQDSRLEDFWKYSDMSEFGQDPVMQMDLES